MNKQFYMDIFPQDESYKLLWTLHDKKSHWFQDVEELIKYIDNNKENIFIGIGTTDKRLSVKKRATAQDITSMRVFHIDIDIKQPNVHANTKLPATIEQANEIAHSILEPTYVIQSGHGLHAYYLTNEHVKITPENFDYWTMLIKTWQQEHGKKFPQYKLDSTYDLSRILRCPGSLNCKDPENIIECKIIEYNKNAYYEPEEIEDAIQFSLNSATKLYEMQQPKEQSIPATQIATNIKYNRRLTDAECKQWMVDNELILAEDRKLDQNVFESFSSNEPEFFEEYCNRTDRKSASEYQFRIANLAIKNGLSDQQTLDVMVQHRAFNRHDIKINRIDVYVNDLIKAKSTYNMRRIDRDVTSNATLDEKEVVREYLFGKLGIQVHTLWRYHRDPESYFELELSNHPNTIIYLGTMTEGVMNQKKFIGSVIAAVKETPKKLKENVWYFDIVQKLNKITKDGITHETATFEGQVKLWVKDYLINKDIIPDLPTYIDNNVKSNPFYHLDSIYFTFEAMAQWIQTSKTEHFDPFHFSITMNKNGFQQESVTGKNGFPISLWKTPPHYLTRTARTEAS
jgi:hypothetical protein